jgi:hypothetical protein
MNIIVDAQTYFLSTFARGSECNLHAELMVEPLFLFLEHLLGFVKLIELGMLPLAIVPALRGLFASGSVGEVGSPSVELSLAWAEWATLSCWWRTNLSHVGSWGVIAPFQRGAPLPTSSQLPWDASEGTT